MPVIEAPRPLDPAPWRPPVVAMWIVAGLAPLARIWSYGEIFRTDAYVVAATITGCVVVLALCARRSWSWATIVPVALVGGAVATMRSGEFLGIWVALAIVQAGWGVLGQPPLPRLRPPAPSARLALLVLAIVTALLYLPRDVAPRLALLSLVGGYLAIAMSSIQAHWAKVALGVVDRGAHLLGRAISIPLLALVGVFGVLVPWAVQRLLRWDPSGVGGRPVRGWSPRTPDVVDDDRRTWLAEGAVRRVPIAARAHGAAVSVVTAVAVVAIVVPLASAASRVLAMVPLPAALQGPPPPPEPEVIEKNDVWLAMEAEPWWSDFMREYNDLTMSASFSQWVGQEFPDTSGRYINVMDHQRRTWSPPTAECPQRVTVWVFGGSTVWGVGNRDVGTVPSALARAAHADGVALDVRNWGMPGEVAWQSVARLERALAVEAEPPDLVVFYDGANDAVVQEDLNRTDRVERFDLFGSLDPFPVLLLSQVGQVEEDGTYVLRQREQMGGRTLTVEESIDRAVEQYLFADRRARLLLDDVGVPFVHVNQPTLFTRASPVEGEAKPRGYRGEQLLPGFRDALPPEIVDMTDTFDEVRTPHFNDDVHVDEAGNEIIGERLYRELSPALAALVEAKEARCS